MEENANTKVCKVCGRELPLDQFRPNHKSPDGHLNTCKECMGQIQKKAQAKNKKEDSFIVPLDEGLNHKIAISQFTEQELVYELRIRGWDVRCTKTIEL